MEDEDDDYTTTKTGRERKARLTVIICHVDISQQAWNKLAEKGKEEGKLTKTGVNA